MVALLRLLASFVADLIKSRRRLEAENLSLRHQLSIALRRRNGEPSILGCDAVLVTDRKFVVDWSIGVHVNNARSVTL